MAKQHQTAVNYNEEQAKQFRDYSKRKGISISTLLRSALLEKIERESRSEAA